MEQAFNWYLSSPLLSIVLITLLGSILGVVYFVIKGRLQVDDAWVLLGASLSWIFSLSLMSIRMGYYS